MSDLQEHARLLGSLLSNFQSLELLLRAYLYDHAVSPHDPLDQDRLFESMKVGDTLTVNALTDYRSLREVISEYNRLIERIDPVLLIDASIISVRDALAHGRISSIAPGTPPYLVKFGRPSRDLVAVEFAQLMTNAWLTEQIRRVAAEIRKAARAPGATVDFGPFE